MQNKATEHKTKPNLVNIGKIVAPHGLKGEVKLNVYSNDPLALKDYKTLQNLNGDHLELTNIRLQGNQILAQVIGMQTRNHAEAACGANLYVEKAELKSAEPEEFFLVDLIDAALFNRAGELLGSVISVQNFGAGDIIEIKLLAKAETEFLPFSKEIFSEIDLTAKKITFNYPEII